MTIHYTPSRAELWHWYKQIWRKRLWQYHIVIICVVFLSFLLSGAVSSVDDVPFLIVPSMISLFVIGLMVLFPQLVYNSAERLMTLDRRGIQVVAGSESIEVCWEEITAITSDGNCVYISRKNGNAFIVPDRAFTSASDRSRFVNSIQEWHGMSKRQSA